MQFQNISILLPQKGSCFCTSLPPGKSILFSSLGGGGGGGEVVCFLVVLFWYRCFLEPHNFCQMVPTFYAINGPCSYTTAFSEIVARHLENEGSQMATDGGIFFSHISFHVLYFLHKSCNSSLENPSPFYCLEFGCNLTK